MSLFRLLLIAALLAVTTMLYWRDQRREPAALPVAAVVTPISAPFQREGFISDAVAGKISHVSALAPLGQDRMAAVWYAGSREGASDVDIVFAEFDGTHWSRSRVLVDRAACRRDTGLWVKKLGNPVIFRDTVGKLWLFYASVAAGGWSASSVNFQASTDEGRTWSRSEKLVLSPFFNLTHNVKNQPLFLEDGSFLLPLHHELAVKRSDLLRVRPRAEGKGIDYQVERMTRHRQAIQAALIPLGGARLRALFRNMQKGPLLSATSEDAGRSWTSLQSLAPHNPNSGLDALRLGSGALLLAMNDGPGRATLSLLLSEDGGATWRVARTVESRPGMEYSYPFLALDDAGRIHLSYTFERQRIKHRVFNEAWVRERLK